jgi:hypothetical protein
MSNDSKPCESSSKNVDRINWKTWLGWCLWLTTISGLYFVRQEGVNRDAEIQRNQKALIVLMERADQTMASMDSNKLIAALAQHEGNLRTFLVRTEASATDLPKALNKLKDVNGRLPGSLGPEGGDMEDALKLAEGAKSAGNTELALVYLVNAIRSQPRDIRLLRKYTAWVLESKNPTIIRGAENLLQEALYGVAAKDVQEVAKQLEDVTNARVAQENNSEHPKDNDLTPAASFVELEKVPLESFSGDRTKVEARIGELSSLLEQIDEADQQDSKLRDPVNSLNLRAAAKQWIDQPDSKLRDQVNLRMEEAQACALAHQVLNLAALRFNNLATTEALVASNATDNHRAAALSALQATEAVVNQVWSVPLAVITPELREKLIVLPESLRTQAEKIQDSVGKVDIDIAREVWKKRPNQTSDKMQDRIIGCQAAIEVCSKTLSKVQGPDSKKEAAALYAQMSGEIKELKERQFALYQKWATSVIEETRKRYDDRKVSSDQDAFAAFYEKDIRKVDQALLSPEVAQFLQAVFSKLLAELDGPGQAQLQKHMSFDNRVNKKSLEDF